MDAREHYALTRPSVQMCVRLGNCEPLHRRKNKTQDNTVDRTKPRLHPAPPLFHWLQRELGV